MINVKNVLGDQDNGRSPLSGIYRARVENNNDEQRVGRVQIRVPQLHGVEGSSNYVEISSLPWAYPVTPAGTGHDHGSLIVPDIGDYVFVMFENGDRSTPIYLGGCFGSGPSNPKPYGSISSNSPSNPSLYGGKGWSGGVKTPETPIEVYDSNNSPTGKVVYKSPKGATILVQDKDEGEFIQILDRIGQTFKLACPVKSSANEGNKSQRAGADADDPNGFPPMNPKDVCVNGTSYALIKDASDQYLKFTATGQDSSIDMVSVDNVNMHMDKDKINLTVPDNVQIHMDKDNIDMNTYDSKVHMDKSQVNVKISSSEVTVKGNSIDVNCPSGNVKVNGTLVEIAGKQIKISAGSTSVSVLPSGVVKIESPTSMDITTPTAVIHGNLVVRRVMRGG